jgi:hypothetical protein
MRSSNQAERLKKLKQGEGTFVYLGGAFDTEAVPGVPALGKDGHQLRTVVFMTVENELGQKVQVVDPASSEKGELVWKKAPQFKRLPVETYKLRLPGVVGTYDEDAKAYVAKPDANGKTPALFLEFPKEKPVFVGDPRLALKLRCFPFFKEVDEAPKGKAKAEAVAK